MEKETNGLGGRMNKLVAQLFVGCSFPLPKKPKHAKGIVSGAQLVRG
jgi:hypothetical protein